MAARWGTAGLGLSSEHPQAAGLLCRGVSEARQDLLPTPLEVCMHYPNWLLPEIQLGAITPANPVPASLTIMLKAF